MASSNLTLEVVGDYTIHCAGCENTIQFSLSRLPGVQKVDADRNTQLIEIDLDFDQTSKAEIFAALTDIGRDAVEVDTL